jgi:hypothetical protein
MKINALMAIGVLFVAAGVVGLVHPQWQGSDHEMDVSVAGKTVIVNTRRIVDIPPLFCGAVIVAGVCVVVLGGLQKGKAPAA